jgi:hypothetical protein
MSDNPVRDFLLDRKQGYVAAFGGEKGRIVLEDLAGFCRAEESTFHVDPRIEGIMQGRREVWIRISKHLNLTPDELVQYFNPTGDTSNE